MGIKLINESDLKSVANAIREKGGTDSSLSFPSGFVDAIENISTGGSSSATSNVVNFRDYDGTIVASYTANDFAELTTLPSNPDHTSEGLTSQGWNWSLSDAKAYVAKYGRLEIGQMYITTDGKTHIHIRLEKGRTSPMLGVCPNGAVDVDWGDGTAHDTLTGTHVTTIQWTSNHNYAAPGDYVIKLTVTGSMGIYGYSATNQYSGLLRYSSSGDARNIPYQSSILKINIGNNISTIAQYAFYDCSNLSSITVPNGVTSIGINTFSMCRSLSSITIPDSVTSIGNNAFSNCSNLSNITIPDSVNSFGTGVFNGCSSISNIIIPDSVTSIEASMFNACYSLSNIIIPNGVASIGSSAFNVCHSLSSITIPDSVTSIGGNAFSSCSILSNIIIPDSVTSIGGGAFNGCLRFSNIIIPNSVTSIGNSAFSGCSSLLSITIPNNITSIGSGMLSVCYSLSSIIIPDSVTRIETSAFSGCSGIAEFHFESTTPPYLANKNAFTSIPADCIIYVPYSEDHSILEAYKTATNWSNYASHMQEEPQ